VLEHVGMVARMEGVTVGEHGGFSWAAAQRAL